MSSWANKFVKKPKYTQNLVAVNSSIQISNETNNLTSSPGRMCNHIIRAHVASIFAKNSNIAINYGQFLPEMTELGINLFTQGTMTHNTEITINDNNFMTLLNIPIYKNINVFHSFFQTKEFSNYLYIYYQKSENQESIINANKFKERYKNNNDVFIHVRLGDVTHLNPGFEYYDKALSRLTFENGFIATDDFNHEICQKLIQKYNLKIIDYNEVDTIMFGSTCKYIILTGGTFSYITGLFGFFSNVYYLKSFNTWFPAELFFIDDWTEISI